MRVRAQEPEKVPLPATGAVEDARSTGGVAREGFEKAKRVHGKASPKKVRIGNPKALGVEKTSDPQY